MQSIDKFLELNKKDKVNIAIVGESMLDEYFQVSVTRISPEFPTQIMHSDNWHPVEVMPGGGANVAVQMSSGFNVNCYLLSFIDERARKVFNKQSFNSEYSVFLNDKETHMPLKRRFYDKEYPLPRWDIESKNYGLSDERLGYFQYLLFNKFQSLIEHQKIDIVVLSDYGKGVFNGDLARQIIELCNLNGIETIVDPKNPPITRWQNCTYFKPNAFESCKMTELPNSNWQKHQEFFEKHNIKTSIITDGANPPFIPIENNIKLARNPVKQSVIGAGDCFCAFLAMCLGRKMDLVDAVEVAWNASSLYIESKHNKPIKPYEFARWNDPIKSKIVTVEEMKTIMDYDKCNWILSNGVYDIIHNSHLELFNFAKKLGDKLIIAINDDASVKRLKGKERPINNLTDRMLTLSYIDCIDFIISFSEDTPYNIIKSIVPNKIVKGQDYKKEYISGGDIVGLDNIILFPYNTNYSTTKIIERIKNVEKNQ